MNITGPYDGVIYYEVVDPAFDAKLDAVTNAGAALRSEERSIDQLLVTCIAS